MNNNKIIKKTYINLLIQYKYSLSSLIIEKNKDNPLIKRRVEPANVTRIIKYDNNTNGVSTQKKIIIQQSKKVTTPPLRQKLDACLNSESLDTFKALLKEAFLLCPDSEEAKQIRTDLYLFVQFWSMLENIKILTYRTASHRLGGVN